MSATTYRHRLYLVLSASHAIKGESALLRAGIPCALIPAPRAASSQCGICLQVGFETREEAGDVLQKAGVQVAGTVDIPADSGRAGI